MFTVPSRDVGGLIGNALGQGFQKGYGNALEYNVGRQRIQKALSGLEEMAQNPEAINNPVKLAVEMYKGMANVPGGAAMVGDIYPLLLRSLNMEQWKQSRPAIPGTGGTAEQPQNLPATETAESHMQQMREHVAGIRPDQPLIQPSSLPATYGGGPIPYIYSPQAIEQTVRTLRDQRAPEDFIQSAKQDMMSFNENSRAQFNDILSGFEVQKGLSEEKARTEDRFLNFVKGNVAGVDDPNDMQRFVRMSQKYANEPNIEDRARKTQIDFNAANRALEQFRGLSRIGHPAFTSEAQQTRDLENNRKAFNTLRDLGVADEAESILADNGLGPVQIAQITNPLSPSENSQVSSLIPDDLMDEKQSLNMMVDEDNIGSLSKDFEKIGEMESKSINNLSNFLRKHVKPFHTDKRSIKRPGTSMILLYKSATDKGMSNSSFLDAVNRAQEQGWQPDADQLREIGEIRKHPTRALGEILRGSF